MLILLEFSFKSNKFLQVNQLIILFLLSSYPFHRKIKLHIIHQSKIDHSYHQLILEINNCQSMN
jgi:hypothetical protein